MVCQAGIYSADDTLFDTHGYFNILSLDIHGRQLIFLRSPLLFFFNMGDKHQRHIKFKGYVRVCYCPGLLLFIKVITFY